MRTTYIPNTLYRATIDNDCLFIVDDIQDKMILRISPIIPSREELKARNFDSVEEFQLVEIQRIIMEELQLESLDIEHLFIYK
ncbi:MAG: hypothetical protein RL308_870 [Bacteroidota bacterium]|jgi:hypothetical protein